MIKKELKELLQKHDSEIFSDELVESVTDLIQVSIDTEVNERVEVIQTAKEKEIEELKESIEIKSKVYGENEIKENEKLVNTMTKWLDELKTELFESNVVDYENVAIVNEAIEIHKNNKQLAEKYLIDIEGLEENMQDKNKLKEAKTMYNQLYKKFESLEDQIETGKKEKITESIKEGLTELQKEDLNKLAKSINESDLALYEEKINDIKEVILGKKIVEKVVVKETVIDNDSTLNEDTEENEEDEAKVKKHKTYDMFGPK